jgi:hypothetical protein
MGMFKKIKLGPLKSLEDITINDMIEYPIWVEDLSGESLDDFDETAERPIVNTKDVTKEMLENYVRVNVLVEVVGTDILSCAYVEDDGTLSTLVAWVNDNWIDLNKHLDERKEIILKPIPSIFGKRHNFKFNHKEDTAVTL